MLLLLLHAAICVCQRNDQAKLEQERRAAAAAREEARAAARALAQQREAAQQQLATQLRERVNVRLKAAAQRRCVCARVFCGAGGSVGSALTGLPPHDCTAVVPM